MHAALAFYVVCYLRVDGSVSVEDSGLCLSTAATRAKECSQSLLDEAKWNERDQEWASPTGNRIAIRRVSFTWEEVKDAR